MALSTKAQALADRGGFKRQVNGQNDIVQVCSLCGENQDPPMDAQLVPEEVIDAWAYRHASTVHGITEADGIEMGIVPEPETP